MPVDTLSAQRALVAPAVDSGAVRLKVAPLVDQLLTLRTRKLRSTTLFTEYTCLGILTLLSPAFFLPPNIW